MEVFGVASTAFGASLDEAASLDQPPHPPFAMDPLPTIIRGGGIAPTPDDRGRTDSFFESDGFDEVTQPEASFKPSQSVGRPGFSKRDGDGPGTRADNNSPAAKKPRSERSFSDDRAFDSFDDS